MVMKHVALRILLALAISSVVANVSADQADDEFARGQKLAKEGKLEEAEAMFESAWSKRQSWDIAGNLGLTEAARSEWRDAAEHLDYAIRHLGALASPEQRTGLQARLDEAKKHVASVTVNATQPCNIKRDATSVGTAPFTSPVFLDPGAHVIEATLEGYRPQRVSVEVREGETKDISITLILDNSGGDAGGGGAGGGVLPERKAVWPAGIGFGIAALSLGAGIGTLVAANSSPEARCPGTKCNAGDDFQKKQNALSNASVWTFVTAGVFAGASTGYLAWSLSGRSPKKSALIVAPVFGPDVQGGSMKFDW